MGLLKIFRVYSFDDAITIKLEEKMKQFSYEAS
jgi:hypothetical protein